MSNCALAKKPSPSARASALKILSAAGFKILPQRLLFYFPRQLRFLCPMQKWLRAFPGGGQHLEGELASFGS
jgi:hypothetical protein